MTVSYTHLAVPAVALNAALGLSPASWKRIGTGRSHQVRWVGYALSGCVAAATVGPYLVLVILACGLIEITVRQRDRPISSGSAHTADVYKRQSGTFATATPG